MSDVDIPVPGSGKASTNHPAEQSVRPVAHLRQPITRQMPKSSRLKLQHSLNSSANLFNIGGMNSARVYELANA